jgi:hypothetical protein
MESTYINKWNIPFKLILLLGISYYKNKIKNIQNKFWLITNLTDIAEKINNTMKIN